jgi:hypothetical protein
MMLRSRTRCFKLISRSLPQVLICSAALGIAGCGGRFLDSSRLLSRSAPSTSADDAPGTATLDDADAPSASPARRFLSSLFNRDSREERSGWDRDPFVDTPVFDRENDADDPAGVAQITGDRAPRTAVNPTGVAPTRVAANAIARAAAAPDAGQSNSVRRTIVRPARRASVASAEPREPSVPQPSHPLGAGPQPTAGVADSRVAAARVRRPRPEMSPEDIPVWARETTNMLPQRGAQTVASNHVGSEGHAHISGVDAHPSSKPDAAQAAAVAAARREIEALLAAARGQGGRGDANAIHRPTPPAVTTQSAPTQRVLLPRNAPAVAVAPEQRAPVQDVARSEAATRESLVETERTIATGPIAETVVAHNDAARQFAMSLDTAQESRTQEESAWSDAQAVGFPVISTWREVRANSPMSLANADDERGGHSVDGWIQQANFSEIPAQYGEKLLADGFANVDQDGDAEGLTSAPPPPLDVNSGIHTFQTPIAGSEKPVLSWGWLCLVIGLTGIGIFAYRKRLHS